MKKRIITIIFCNFIFLSFGQKEIDSTQQKTNPIIYVDGLFGYANGNLEGFTVGGGIYYQNNKDLFSIRIQNHSQIDKKLFFIFPFSAFFSKIYIDEFSILYGKRFIDEGNSYSISLGVSNNIKHIKVNQNEENFWKEENYIGFPFELNIRWFKNTKKRFRVLYGTIPIGKKTGFGRSIGIKLYGNIGKTSYIGIGINVGFGWHKKY